MYGQTQRLLLFPHWFGSLAVNARAIIEISINSHQISAVCQTKLIKFNTHIWSMLWHVFHRFYRCLMHHSTQNCYVNTALNMGTPKYMYIGYGMLVQYQIVVFSYINYVYTVCHVDHYIKVHQVQIKFWLIMANSASDHSFRHPLSVLVMTYSLTA